MDEFSQNCCIRMCVCVHMCLFMYVHSQCARVCVRVCVCVWRYISSRGPIPGRMSFNAYEMLVVPVMWILHDLLERSHQPVSTKVSQSVIMIFFFTA